MKEYVFYVAGHHSIMIYWATSEKSSRLQDIIKRMPELGGVYLGEL